MSDKQTLPRTLTGVVVSDKMDKAIVVHVERRVKHPKYRKYIRRTTKVHAQDVENSAKKGDVVVVRECRPVSKTITWSLIDIKERAA